MTFLYSSCAWNVQINLPLTLEIFLLTRRPCTAIVLSRDICIEVCEFCYKIFWSFYICLVWFIYGFANPTFLCKKKIMAKEKINITDKSNLNSLI